jgi:hypothetical protein
LPFHETDCAAKATVAPRTRWQLATRVATAFRMKALHVSNLYLVGFVPAVSRVAEATHTILH